MQHRTVFEVMTHKVVTLTPATLFKEIVRLFNDNDITAAPVGDHERLPLGVVSEADLLRPTAELPDLEDRWACARLLSQEGGSRDEETAEELTTSPAVTARPEWNRVETARTMRRKTARTMRRKGVSAPSTAWSRSTSRSISPTPASPSTWSHRDEAPAGGAGHARL
ncbi:CBS domain-containing protein [Streptomyces sp. NPDC057428]|uniref:CBS domain-containing protein n=1 Tax=Streptomyces sp. NPDC057428 TaxID=3346129 RepID=UPI0036AE46E8